MDGEKFDAGKPSWSLLPLNITREVVNVLTFGAAKYSRENWRKVPYLQDRYYDALLRHLDAYRGGETHDKESGYHHLAHAVCCIMFMAEDNILSSKQPKKKKPSCPTFWDNLIARRQLEQFERESDDVK